MISERHCEAMNEQSSTRVTDSTQAMQDSESAENDTSTLASDPEEVSPSTYDEAESEEAGREMTANSSREFLQKISRGFCFGAKS